MANPFLDDTPTEVKKKNPFLESAPDAAPPAQPTAPAQPGFFSRVGTDITNRANEGADAIVAYHNKEQGLPATALDLAGKMGAAPIGDIIGEGAKSVAGALPAAVKAPVKAAGDYLAETSVGKAGIEAARQGVEAYGKWAKANPNIARHLESVVDIGSVIPAGKAAVKGMEAVAPVVNKGVQAVTTDAAKAGIAAAKKSIEAGKQLTADEIKNYATQSYKLADEQGGVLHPKFFEDFVSEVQKLTPQTEKGRKLAGNSPFTSIVNDISALNKPARYDPHMVTGAPGEHLTLHEAQEIDEYLGAKVDSLLDKGRMTKEASKVLDIQTKLRDMIDGAKESDVVGGKQGFDSLKDARFFWSQQAKMRDIEKIITRAELTDNPATAIKSGFRSLYTNPARMRGFSPEEKKLIKNAAQSGVISDTLRTLLGSRLIPIAHAAAGGGFGSTLASQAGALAARNAATGLQIAKANKVAKAISDQARKRIPSTPIGADFGTFNSLLKANQ